MPAARRHQPRDCASTSNLTGLVNEVTLTYGENPEGGSQPVVTALNGGSQARYGRYEYSSTVLLEVQFELPSRRDVKKCVVTRETIEKGLTPTLVTEAAPDEESDEARERSA